MGQTGSQSSPDAVCVTAEVMGTDLTVDTADTYG